MSTYVCQSLFFPMLKSMHSVVSIIMSDIVEFIDCNLGYYSDE